jgi:hypothetical protein
LSAPYRSVEHAIAAAFAPVIEGYGRSIFDGSIGDSGLTRMEMSAQNAIVHRLAERVCTWEELHAFRAKYAAIEIAKDSALELARAA